MTRAQPYNRDTALNAAMNLFWQKGYHATSLKDLEAALDMKPGSIYAAFKSKEALFRATLERYFQNLQAGFRDMMETGTSPLSVLTGFLRNLGRGELEDEPCSACMLIKTVMGETASDAAISEDARRYLDLMKSQFSDIFDKAKAAGELPADMDSEHLALRYQSNISALKIEHKRGTDQAAIARLAETMAQDFERLRVKETVNS